LPASSKEGESKTLGCFDTLHAEVADNQPT
jgi:hypothetical protein